MVRSTRLNCKSRVPYAGAQPTKTHAFTLDRVHKIEQKKDIGAPGLQGVGGLGRRDKVVLANLTEDAFRAGGMVEQIKIPVPAERVVRPNDKVEPLGSCRGNLAICNRLARLLVHRRESDFWMGLEPLEHPGCCSFLCTNTKEIGAWSLQWTYSQ